ncbi:RdgB/HAM1 family non-canonical purine NTP pyrophosphatase [bacterium]|nr:RdgB/HAM1 family non-canonical purine NTP pyrophosphatase [bacterium]
MKQIVLATRNSDKITEIEKLMQLDHAELVGIHKYPQAPDVIEDGDSLRANALKKARSAFKATGLPSIADDSGLEVDFLEGAPGVFSSRFAGENATYSDNNVKLIRLLIGVPKENRKARFRCVACLVDQDHEHCIEGICEGTILDAPSGNQGFGYDPLFYMPQCDKTFAEMSLEEKNKISHRGRAFREMGDYVRKIYGV